ncbi:MAG: mechanosensitive ion channel [Thermodesulfobacteriota bacterium]|nr:mechanosensitive ion channel [Thermodesulfobacteriota bacterium]
MAFIFLAVAAVAGLIAHVVLFAVFKKIAARTSTRVDDSVFRRLSGPTRLVVMLAALNVVSSLPEFTLSESAKGVLGHAFAVAWTVAAAWLVIRGVYALQDMLLPRFDVSEKDNLRARKIHTQAQVFNKIFVVVVTFLALGVVLMHFEQFRRIGTSLLASAGVAGIVIGLAAQKTIANVLSGIQLAFTQPIRLDDVVIVEGEWGRIEEITFTYVVVKIWDLRRLVLPVSYFLERPFQNWTRVSADILGTVFIYADFRIPVDAVREELSRIVQDHPLWDGKVCGLQVTNVTERTVELRALVSAETSPKLWDLRCHVREKLIAYMQKNFPQSLPRFRAEMPGSGEEEKDIKEPAS